MMIQKRGKKSMASEARHLIWIQTETSNSDGEGGFVKTWTDTTKMYAAIYPIKAKQVMEYRTINVHATHHIKIRGANDVSELNQVRYGTRFFEILTVENLQERDIQKFITTKEIRS